MFIDPFGIYSIFFYVFGETSSSKRLLLDCGNSDFSMTSGFFNTNAYQLASKAVEPDEQVRVASIMSFVFTIGLNVALLCATILQEHISAQNNL